MSYTSGEEPRNCIGPTTPPEHGKSRERDVSRTCSFRTSAGLEGALHKTPLKLLLIYFINYNMGKTLQQGLSCTHPVNIYNVLLDLHWLPIHRKIEFNIILLSTFVYMTWLHGIYPTCRIATHSLRSAEQQLLVVLRSKLKQYGDSSLNVVAPVLCNALPVFRWGGGVFRESLDNISAPSKIVFEQLTFKNYTFIFTIQRIEMCVI